MTAMIFYVVAMSNQADGGIYRYELTPEKTILQRSFTPLARANYLTFSPDRKYLYATCAVGDGGGVASFSVGPEGELTKINESPAEGKSTCHVATDPSGTFLFAPNYSSASCSAFPLKDGKIGAVCQQAQHFGSGPNRNRQEAPHPHFTGVTPDGRYLTVIDLGTDELRTYPLDSKTGFDKDHPIVTSIVPGGSGPRHLVFNRAGKTAYLLNEVGNTVMVLDYADGQYTIRQTVTTLPEGDFVTKAAAIRLSPDERFLYASNRGYDSIAQYRINPDGTLALVEIVGSEGVSPRDFNFLPDPEYMLVTNEFTNNAVLFRVDAKTGNIRPLKTTLSLPNPLCVMNLPELK